MQELDKCPICGGKAVWCDSIPDIEEGEGFSHECSYIRCTGECKTEFLCNEGTGFETVAEEKAHCAKVFNKRA